MSDISKAVVIANDNKIDLEKIANAVGNFSTQAQYWVTVNDFKNVGYQFAKELSSTAKTLGNIGVIFNGISAVGVYFNDDYTNEEKTGRIAAEAISVVVSLAVIATPVSVAIGAGLVYAVAVNTLDSEDYQAIGDTILTTPDRWQSELLAEIAETTGVYVLMENPYGDELGEETALLSSIDWNAVGEGLTSFFKAQVEMEMAFEGYLPENLVTTDVYTKGISAQRDPIILDLNGDGVTTTNVKENYVNFDLDANGFAERTGWIDGNDGFLVRDINGNGKIDDGTEMFGDKTLLKNGKTASNGYEALADLDDNRDGKIDSNDAIYEALRIWQDMDRDGITDAGELHTLAEMGIESINTNYRTANTTDNGNKVYGTGSYTKSDGTTGKTADMFFSVDTVNTTADESGIAYTQEILDLPDLKGYGTVHFLHYAMAKDTTGELKTLVKQYVDSTNETEKDTLLDQIIFKWTGADGVSPTKYGSYIDGRKMAVLEAIYGQNWTFSIL